LQRTFALLSVFACWGFTANAQIDRAELAGVVTDASGGSIPGAVIKITGLSTGLQRKAATTEAGFYSIGNLPVGTYEAVFSSPAFQTIRYASIRLAVGEKRTLNVQMQVASASQEVHVEATVSALAETGAELGGVVSGQQVENLPLNGRSWASLMALVPGAIDTGTGTASSIRFVGKGNDDNNFRLDGVDQSGVGHQFQNVNFRLQVPTESIAEFRVNASLYSAVEGGTPGGQVQIVSKSGTNSFHASAYEFFRNDKLDARSPFDPSVLPPLRLNQFGTSAGGAIVKNKAFFFANYEGLRQRIGQTLIAFVPSDSFRAAALAQSPQIAPLVNAYPRGTVPVSADVSQVTTAAAQSIREDSGLIRFDYQFNESNTFFARYDIDQAQLQTPKGNLTDHTTTVAAPMNGTIQFLHLFSPEMFDQLELGINRIRSVATTASLLYNSTGILTSLTIPGFETLNSYAVKVSAPTTGSLVDHWGLLKGKHSIRAGAEVRIVHYNLNNPAANILAYASRPAFAADQLNQLTLVDEIPMTGQHEVQYAGYLQDEMKIRPNLTAMLGLRYDFFNRFHEIYGRDHPFDIETCGGYCPFGSEYSIPVTDDFQPRASIAWAPSAFHNRTVIRAGAGLYAGQGALDDLTGPNDSAGTRYVLSLADAPGLTYPFNSFLSQAVHAAVAPRALERNRGDGEVAQWGLQIQTALGDDFVLQTGYQGSHGYKIFARNYINMINPLTGTRPLPAFGQIDIKRTDGITSFDGWQTSLQRRFHAGWLFSVNYMWSHSLNDGATGGGEAVYPEIAACRSCDKSSSDQDIRHSFSANSVYELPFGTGRRFLTRRGLANGILGGWRLSMIATARTGLPVNVTTARAATAVPDGNTQTQRPNLLPGVSLIPSGGQTVQDWINAAAFVQPANGTFGNAGRNLVRAPGLWQADVSLGKDVRVAEHATMEFLAAAFNLFNRAQFGAPITDFSSASFGRITTTINSGATGSGTPRQFQFMIRLTY
jgi:hypothetical protein